MPNCASELNCLCRIFSMHLILLEGLAMTVSRIAIFLLISFATCALAHGSNMSISREEQQARDKDRHMILRTELIAEHQELAKAQAAFGAAATPERAAEVHRSSENVKALQRELASFSDRQESRAAVRYVTKVRGSAKPKHVQRDTGSATFWNPYNRSSEPEASSNFSTTP